MVEIFEWVYGFGHTVFWAVVVLGFLVFIHELGHFWVAKKLGIGVTTFSLGFGKRLWGFQRGETEYRLSLVPLGGYVKLVGEDPEANAEDPDVPAEPEDPEKSFYLRPVSHRMAVIFAGPLANILLAVVLGWVLSLVGMPVLGTWVGKVLPNSPALTAGLQADDRIIGINGISVRRWKEMADIIEANAGKKLLLQVERKNSVIELSITPASRLPGGKGKIGIAASRTFIDRYGPLDAVWKSLDQTYEIIHLTVTSLYGMVVQTVPADIGGPIRISRVAAEQAKRGLRYVVGFAILLSLNLAILNLLPIPILDGGHMLFLTIEALRGKPISLRIREMSMQVGMVLLIGLMVFATYKDSVYYFLQWTR